MKRTFMGMLAVMAVSLLPTTRVVAEEITFASHAEIMSVLERQNMRIAELESALHNGGGCSSCGGDSCCDSCDSGCGCCDPCCRPAGVIGGAEIAFLKPHHSLGIRGANNTDMDYSYEASHRIWAGYQGSDGLGWRIRYWEFNHTVTAPDVTAPADRTDSVNYDTYIIDLEFVDSMSLGCYWDASIFGGFRYVEFDELYEARVTATGVPVTGRQFDNSSYGLTLGGELRRCIGNGLAGFVNTRASVLMGDEDELVDAAGAWVVLDEELDNIYYIWEAQAGAQWTRELQQGGYLFARAAVEVQFWDNFSGEPTFDGGESWGLGGFAFSAGIIR
jgi:hypothetical protein